MKSSCPQRKINLNTELQAIAISVTLDREITICSVYIPPSFSLKIEHLDSLLKQLPSPYLLLGDFNGHNILWGNKENNSRGELIENFITNNDICLMNDKSNTYMHDPTGSFSSIDLSLCHPSLFLDFNWSVCKDQHHSDHFPIVIKSNTSTVEDHNPKWKLSKANWELFQSLCTDTITLESFKDSSDPLSDFTSSLIDISSKCIPKTSTNPTKSNPWYNDECKEAIKTRKKALNKFKKYPTKDNLNEVKVFRAKARRTIKISKRKSWRSYVSKINHKTPIKKVWDMIRKISGKTKSPSYTHLNHPVTETKSTSKFDIAETLGETFLNNSCSRNYSEKFQKVKAEQEKIKLNFKSANTEEYNNLFNFDELLDAIKQSHDSATGPDEIHYQMLKHLPESSLQALLGIFNHIWTTGDFPEDWRLATVIPIPKPGKDHAEPTNYRPIALTSCLCKTLERMINKRLIWYLESNNLLSRYQSGFRAGRSTNNNLVKLETFIRDAFVKKEHVVAVFFDLEKAYDTTWRYGIMKDIHKLGLRGRLPTFIESFLADRAMQVRVGSTLSDLYDQEQGVPQGGVLSTTLFNIKINDIVKCLDNLTDCSLYVDDFCICFRSKSMRTIERHLQQNLNKIEHWATNNGFKFSKSKTQCVHFCQLRKQHDDPVLTLYGSPIPVVQEYKYLGLIFDKKLSFIPHIKYLKAKCLKSLNILKVLSHTTWGADRTTLLQLYRSLIRSKLDYGSIVYGSARKSYLAMLDPIHHQGLRLTLGAFRTSPTASLYVEADEPSLNTRREKLSLQYAINIWTTGKFPEDWTLATIIPIPKPGKDPAEPNNYRPIALTSCLCKTLERMINKRLTWFLESNNHISRFQSGFRSDRSTTDNLVRLETFIRDAFIKKEHVVAVFFDLEKAYDTTWRYGILKDIHKLGLRGRLPTFIENFLADRTMQVRVGSSLSDYYDQEQGVPQGGVLSTTLFSIKINDIVKCLGNLTDCSLYVDDFCICYRSKSMATIDANCNKI